MCEHKEVLFVPTATTMDISGNTLSLTSEPKFICVACKEYVSRPTDRSRIVNVPKYDPSECLHPNRIYTLGATWICLNCGTYMRIPPPKLDIETDPDWGEKDKRFRVREVAKWLIGEQEMGD